MWTLAGGSGWFSGLRNEGARFFEFDVALSYASEDFIFVEAVASCLKTQNVSVFYDRDYKVAFWGKPLGSRLSEVYGKNARFCVMFISMHYALKHWTNYERRKAQERAAHDESDYILPVRLDETPLEGLSEDVAYIDAKTFTPTDLALAIVEKLKQGKHWPRRDVRLRKGRWRNQEVLSALRVVTACIFISSPALSHKHFLAAEGDSITVPVSITVRSSETGHLVHGARLLIHRGGVVDFSDVPTHNGRFECGLPPGHYSVVAAYGVMKASQDFEVSALPTDATVDLPVEQPQ